jgi:hypothetical protein
MQTAARYKIIEISDTGSPESGPELSMEVVSTADTVQELLAKSLTLIGSLRGNNWDGRTFNKFKVERVEILLPRGSIGYIVQGPDIVCEGKIDRRGL